MKYEKYESKKDTPLYLCPAGDTFIVTEDIDGKTIVITGDYADILADYHGDEEFTTYDDARVFFAAYNGVPVSPYQYSTFGQLMFLLYNLAGLKERPKMKTVVDAAGR